MTTWLFPSVISTLFATFTMVLAYGYVFIKERREAFKIFLYAWIVYLFPFIFRILDIFLKTKFLADLVLVFTLLNGALLFIASRKLLNKNERKITNILFLISPAIIPLLKAVKIREEIILFAVFILSGMIYIFVGMNFLKNQINPKKIQSFVGISFIIWGIHKLDYPFLNNSIIFTPIGFLLGTVITLLSALGILMLYYDLKDDAYKKNADELRTAKDELERSNRVLKQTKERLRLKLDFITSPEIQIDGVLALTDVIDIELLQNIQDTFAAATDVAAIITDAEGVPVTRPSNFTGVCRMIRQTEIGSAKCILSDRALGKKSAEVLRPVYEDCKSCGFIDAAAPIIIGKKHIANWMIGQVNLGTASEVKIKEYADEIGVDRNNLLDEYNKIKPASDEKFRKLVKLLWIFSQEISGYAYNNLLLAKKLEEEKQIKVELEKAKNAAEESDRLKTAFLSNVSHEIRTPLNGLLGFADLLSKQNITKDDSSRYIDIMQQSGQRLLRTIDDLIDISIIESGQIEIIKTGTMIENIFNVLLSVHKHEIENKGLELFFSNPRNFEIVTDEEKLKTILSNILRNAIKYTKEGCIEITVTDEDDLMYVEIADTGIGIPEERIDSIFNRFEQVEYDYSRSYEGSGLGLSIAREYVEAMGGAITVQSQVADPSAGKNGWSRFLIKLPKKI